MHEPVQLFIHFVCSWYNLLSFRSLTYHRTLGPLFKLGNRGYHDHCIRGEWWKETAKQANLVMANSDCIHDNITYYTFSPIQLIA